MEGCCITRQRAAIIKVMRENHGHFTAEEIFLLTQKEYPSIVRATIYNNLNHMAEEGLVRRICQSGQPDRFDRNSIPHEHIICVSCGKVIDVMLDNFKNRLSEEIGCEIVDYELVIHCECPECRAKIN